MTDETDARLAEVLAGTAKPLATERRGPRRRTILFVVAIALVLYTLVAGSLVVSARNDVLAGRDALTSLAATDPLSADFSVLATDLRVAGDPISSGVNKLESPLLWPLRPLPVVGRQLASARGLARTAEVVVADATVVVELADELRVADERERVNALSGLETALGVLVADLVERDLGPTNNLVGPLASAHNDAQVQLVDLEQRAIDAHSVVGGLRRFLERSEYLLLAANINEMQVGAGTPLSLGAVTVEGGDFSVSSIETLVGVEVDEGLPAVDDDVSELWGFLAPTNDFKKLMLSPRFDQWGGPQSLLLYEATFGRDLDGALVMDPVALEALLTIVGPVIVDGEEYTSDNVLRYIFIDQYDEFLTGEETTDNLSTFNESDLVRRDRLAAIAAETVALLATEEWDPLDLIEVLRPIAAGRHLLAYSEDATEQAMWNVLGISGHVDGDEVGVALLNIGVNKLDPFVEVDVDISEEVQPDGTRILDFAVTIANNAPAGLDEGITGYYWETIGLPTAASYLGRLMFLLPASTTDLELVDDDLKIEVFGRDGPLATMVVRLEPIVEGTSSTIRARAVLSPEGTDQLQLLPSARYIPIGYTWSGQSFEDTGPRMIELLDQN